MTAVRCVVDTNVLVVANGGNDAAGAACAAASAVALRNVQAGGHLFIDEAGEIVAEYRNNLNAFGAPLPGNAFLKWLLTNEYNPSRVTRVRITPDPERGYVELPAPTDGVRYDPSDRKFLAVSAAHPERPVVVQAFDSKWWGWQDALKAAGISVTFLCPAEIGQKYEEKMEKTTETTETTETAEEKAAG